MTYLLLGNINLINKELDKIKQDVLNTNIINYDLEEHQISEVLYDLDSFNLFGGKKLIIASNFDEDKSSDELIKYLNHQSDNILVLISNKKLDERKKITKELKKNVKVIDLTNIDLTDYIKESFKDYKIDFKAINTLKDYCGNDYEKLKNEIDKLKMYKLDTMEVLEKDIKKIVKKSFDTNIFDLTNAINKKDKKKIFEVYYELKNNNEDEIRLISVLANNFKLIYKIKIITSEYKDEDAISILKIHPYRFKILKEESYNYKESDLLKLIKDLGDIDIDIKSGKQDKRQAIELFFTKI